MHLTLEELRVIRSLLAENPKDKSADLREKINEEIANRESGEWISRTDCCPICEKPLTGDVCLNCMSIF